jgi:hypothetical protein
MFSLALMPDANAGGTNAVLETLQWGDYDLARPSYRRQPN